MTIGPGLNPTDIILNETESGPFDMRILLVDDNPIVRQTLVKYINRLKGIEIAGHAGTVQEATRLMQTVQPDVAILDYKLIDGTAVEILTELKNQGLEVITLILTNYGTEPYRQVCTDAGADYFYHKTHDFQRLFDQLEEINRNNHFPMKQEFERPSFIS